MIKSDTFNMLFDFSFVLGDKHSVLIVWTCNYSPPSTWSTGPLADTTCQGSSVCTEMKDVVMLSLLLSFKKKKKFGDQPVSHLCFWGLPLVYFLESESQSGDCISWWKASLSAMLRPCISSVKSHSVSQTPQAELVLYQCCSQGWAWLNFLKQMTILKTVPVANKATLNYCRLNSQYDVIPAEPDLTF